MEINVDNKGPVNNNITPKNISSVGNDKQRLGFVWTLVTSIVVGLFVGVLFFDFVILYIIRKIPITNAERYHSIILFFVTTFPWVIDLIFILLIFFILKKCKSLCSGNRILVRLSPIAIIQLVLSLIIGHVYYCGIEGTCWHPLGFTFLLIAINLFIDLLVILFLSVKNKFSPVSKTIIIILILISIILLYLSYLTTKKDNEEIRRKIQAQKMEAENYVKEVFIPEQQKEQQKKAACNEEFEKQLNAHTLIASSDRISQQGNYQIYDYTLGINTAYNPKKYTDFTRTKLFVPKEFKLFVEPPKNCPDTFYYLGFWDGTHNLYIQEDNASKAFKFYNQYVYLYDLLNMRLHDDVLAQFNKKEINDITVYYSKELQTPFYIIVSLVWNPQQNDWTHDKRFVYSVANGDIDQNLVEKLLESVGNIRLEK